MNARQEVWKDVPGFPGYQVSDQGRVRSYRARWRRRAKPVIVKPMHSGWDPKYWSVRIQKDDGRRATKLVHHLVLIAFVGPRPKDKECGCHRDDNPLNNRLGNLYWGTHHENHQDGLQNGADYASPGSKHPFAKLTEDQVRTIRARFEAGARNRDLAKEYGFSEGSMSLICHRKRWKHI